MKHTLDFKHALVTGGGGGLGYAMSSWLIAHDKKVTIVGRTESKLQEAAKTLGNDTSYYVLDTGKVADIPGVVKKVLSEHADIDCVINNAYVLQSPDSKSMMMSETMVFLVHKKNTDHLG